MFFFKSFFPFPTFTFLQFVRSYRCLAIMLVLPFLFFPSLTDIQLTLIVGVLFSKDLDSPYLTAHTHTHLHREWVCVGLLSKFGTLRCFFFLYRKLRQVQEIYISLICKFNKQTCACCLFSSNYVVSPELGFA